MYGWYGMVGGIKYLLIAFDIIIKLNILNFKIWMKFKARTEWNEQTYFSYGGALHSREQRKSSPDFKVFTPWKYF